MRRRPNWVRKSCVLQLAPEWIEGCQLLELLLHAENLQDSQIGTHRDSSAPTLHAAQGHGHHASAFRHLPCRQTAAEPCQPQALAQTAQQVLGRWQQC
jgi:hypothetical protein